MLRPMFLPLILVALLAGLSARAQDVDLELVLLADATGSIDEDEILFQRQGYADAISDPGVLAVIAGTAYGKIAVTYVEWAAANSQAVVVPWTIIDGPGAAQEFADQLMRPPRLAFGRNAIGAALLKGKDLIETNGIDGWRKVIDFSGDSANNYAGPSIASARAAVLAAGITINGLPILCRGCSGPSSANLAERYRTEIIGGIGAFVVEAETLETFAESVRKKLILEISDRRPTGGTDEVARVID